MSQKAHRGAEVHGGSNCERQAYPLIFCTPTQEAHVVVKSACCIISYHDQYTWLSIVWPSPWLSVNPVYWLIRGNSGVAIEA